MAPRTHWAQRVAALREALTEQLRRHQLQVLGRRPSLGLSLTEQMLGRLPREVDAEETRRSACHRERCHAQQSVRLRVRRVRQKPPRALEKTEVQKKDYRVHHMVHEASHIASKVWHCDKQVLLAAEVQLLQL